MITFNVLDYKSFLVMAKYKESKKFCKIPQDPIQTLASPDPYSGRNTQGRYQLVLTSPPRNLLVFQTPATSSSPNSLFQAPLLLHDG